MDSGLAKWHVSQVFMVLDNSGPIYCGDNLDQFTAMSDQRSRLYLKTRPDLERLKIRNRLDI